MTWGDPQCLYFAQINSLVVEGTPRGTVKKGKCFFTLAEYGLTYDGWFPQQLEEYFYCHPQRFFASYRQGIPSINKEGIFPSI
jgi:hypothetical protein